MFDYDAELRHYNEWLRAAADIDTFDQVLDIGCGTGQTTRDAARTATAGCALGVDLSGPRIDRARQLSEEQQIRNIQFQQVDAQTCPFLPATYNVAISRFGTMFFHDPIKAFTNIARALRPGARLVQLTWQPYDRQAWTTEVRRSLTGIPAEPRGPTPAAFSLADPATVADILTSAGFTAVELTEICEPVYYGQDADHARDALLELGMVQDALADMGPSDRARALDRLQLTLEAHDTGDGIWFDASAWMIQARRR